VACAQDIEGLAKVSMVDVPVSWIGIAEEVKMMGSFDNWSRGVDLSPEDYTFSGEQTVRVAPFLSPPLRPCTNFTAHSTFLENTRDATRYSSAFSLSTKRRSDPSLLRGGRPVCARSFPRRWSCCLGSTKSSSS